MTRSFEFLLSLIFALSVLSTDAAPPSIERRKADVEEIKSLELKFRRFYQRKAWDKAIEVGQELVTLSPKRGVHAYNLACVYSLGGQPEDAAHWLIESAANGFSNLRLLTSDTDLDAVRTNEDFKKAASVVARNLEESVAILKQLFKKTTVRIVEPPNYEVDKPVPLIVALHGYGGTAGGMVGAWQKAAAEFGALLVVPQAVHPGPGMGYSWTGEDRMSANEAEYLVRWTVDLVLQDYKIDRNCMILTGFSQGGFVSLAVGPRQPYIFSGVIPMAGGYIRNLDAPQKAVDKNAPRFYFMVGANDRPVEEMREASTDFAEAGYATRLRVYPRAGHTFPINPEAELRQALDFVSRR